MALFDKEYGDSARKNMHGPEVSIGMGMHPAMHAYVNFILDGTESTRENGQGSYLDWVRRHVVQGRTLPEDAPCFLDTIAAWLIFGDAVEACGAYENYLVLVICLVVEWADRVRDHEAIRDIRLGGEGISQAVREYEYFANNDGELEKERRERWPNLPPVEIFGEAMPMARLDYKAWRHPALSRTTWDLAVAGRPRHFG
ncbi:hypothetical protein QN239_07160 [Mycolicibacterium sp. Y3]